MKPSNLRQFASIMKDLNILHVTNFVHGDITKENLRFSRDCEEAWIATLSHKPSWAGCIPAGDIKRLIRLIIKSLSVCSRLAHAILVLELNQGLGISLYHKHRGHSRTFSVAFLLVKSSHKPSQF